MEYRESGQMVLPLLKALLVGSWDKAMYRLETHKGVAGRAANSLRITSPERNWIGEYKRNLWPKGKWTAGGALESALRLWVERAARGEPRFIGFGHAQELTMQCKKNLAPVLPGAGLHLYA